MSNGKRIILIRMIPFDQKFDELLGRQIFGLNKLELTWLVGTPMPADLPDEIVKAIGLPKQSGSASSPTPARTSDPDIRISNPAAAQPDGLHGELLGSAPRTTAANKYKQWASLLAVGSRDGYLEVFRLPKAERTLSRIPVPMKKTVGSR